MNKSDKSCGVFANLIPSKPLTTKDVAKRLGCCTRVARRIITQEMAHFWLGNKLRVESQEVENWIHGRLIRLNQTENSQVDTPKKECTEITEKKQN